jgi:hypothetical protein
VKIRGLAHFLGLSINALAVFKAPLIVFTDFRLPLTYILPILFFGFILPQL